MLGQKVFRCSAEGFSMLGGRRSMLGRRVFRCSPEGDGCRRTWIDAGGPFTLLSFVVMRHLSLSAGSFSLFAGTHPSGPLPLQLSLMHSPREGPQLGSSMTT